MKKIKGMSINSIVMDMVDMGVRTIKDIKEYGFTDKEAKEIKKELDLK